jgi:LytS/YehU family sensor histidine kinase
VSHHFFHQKKVMSFPSKKRKLEEYLQMDEEQQAVEIAALRSTDPSFSAALEMIIVSQKAVAEAVREKEEAVAVAVREKEDAIAVAGREKEEAVAEAVRQAAAKEEAVAEKEKLEVELVAEKQRSREYLEKAKKFELIHLLLSGPVSVKYNTFKTKIEADPTAGIR